MKKYRIYLKKPSRKWDEGLPLGNGRLGAMVMGRLKEETIYLNEETLCYGPARERENPDAYGKLEEIRKLLQEGRVEGAAFLAKMALTSTPKYNNPYQPAGDLRLCFLNHTKKESGYKAVLDLGSAIAKVSYELEDTAYEREIFVSTRYQVLAVRIRAEGKHTLTMSANISRKPFEEFTGNDGKRTAYNRGENGVQGMHYASAVRIAGEEAKTLGDCVYIEDKKEIIVYVAAATDYEVCLQGKKKPAKEAYKDLMKTLQERLDQAEKAGFEELKKAHLEEYQKLYEGFELELGGISEEALSTGELLEEYRQGNREKEAYLTELLVAYARYLMLASSRDCLLPANLQGIWNGLYEPPWQCQYTININTQMNYWFIEKAGLSVCHAPFYRLVKLLAKNGEKTAKRLYHARGFCAHHNTNVWGSTAPEGIFDASPYWVTGGAWMCLHLFEHYLYTEDQEYLKEILPIMRESIRFFEDYLYELPNGWLVTGPVVSPENTYRSYAGETGALCMGTAMDSAILRQLFASYLEALKLLGIEEDFDLIKNMLVKLPPLQLGEDERLLEWMEDYEELEPGHRHISHLYALHPGHEITPEQPKLWEGAKKTLKARMEKGGGHTGWSRAWLACFAARLRDGEGVLEHIGKLLCNCIQDNLLDVHPPFQIDGNFGIAEAILEGVVQNHRGRIILLPALPINFQTGSIKGYRAEGGVQMNFVWENGTPVSIKLQTKTEKTIELCWQQEKRTVICKANETIEMDWK